LVRKLEGKSPLGRPTYGCKDNITMDFTGYIFEGMDSICMARGREEWQALVSTVTIFRVPKIVGNFFTS
jgi:hypothetical protein